MRATPGLLTVLLLTAVAAVVLVVLATTAPASCDDAKESADAQLMHNAQKEYAAILRDEPRSACATAGMHRVIHELCARAGMMAEGAPEEAKKAYLAILSADLPDWDPDNKDTWNVGCALNGLKQLPTPTPPAGS